MSTQATPQPQANDAWGQAQAEMNQTAQPQTAQPQANAQQPKATQQPQANDVWGQAQAELNGQTSQPQETGITRNEDGSFVITPKEGESFADTMRRAANAGKTVTPEMIQSQTKKGLKEAPAVLAAAPVIGAAIPATEAGIAELPEGAKIIREMAKAHPEAAKFIKKVLTGAIAGHSMGHTAVGAGLGALWDLL